MFKTLPSEAKFSSEASNVEGNPTGCRFLFRAIWMNLFFQVLLVIFCFATSNAEAVKELYDKIIESVVVKRTMAPNAWLWSLIENCKNHDDIKLLFDVLENLRRFVSFELHSFVVRIFFTLIIEVLNFNARQF